MTLRSFNDDGKRDTQIGDYSRGEFTVDKQTYEVERIPNGVRTTHVRDRDNSINFRRGAYNGSGGHKGESDDWGSNSSQDWAVGTFSGYNERHNQDRELVIERSGRATLTYRNRSSGRGETLRGNWRSDRLTLSGSRFNLERTRSGIRLVDTADRSNSTAMERGGGFVPPAGRPEPSPQNERTNPPVWIVGTFRGRNAKYDGDEELTVDRSGSVALNSTDRRGKITTSAGYYGQDGRIHIARVILKIERSGSGFRTTDINDSASTVNYRR